MYEQAVEYGIGFIWIVFPLGVSAFVRVLGRGDPVVCGGGSSGRAWHRRRRSDRRCASR